MIDALFEVNARSQARRKTVIWSCVGIASIGMTVLVYIEWLPGWLRIASFVCGAIMFFIYLAWLSTTEIGKLIAESLRT